MRKEEQNLQVREWQASGKSKWEWAREKGIPYTTFINWARRIPKETGEEITAVAAEESEPPMQQEIQPVKWAAVKPAPTAKRQLAEGSCVHISCGRFEVRIPEGVSAELLSDVLRAVNEICC